MLNNTKVVAFINHGQWNQDLMIINIARPQHVATILNTPLQVLNGVLDKPM